MSTKVDELADHLRASAPGPHGVDRQWVRKLAEKLLSEPFTFAAVLVDAGLLEEDTFCTTHGRLAFNEDHSDGPCRICGGEHIGIYRVIKPHEHDWRVEEIAPGRWGERAEATVRCAGCRTEHSVKLDEWPKYEGEVPPL